MAGSAIPIIAPAISPRFAPLQAASAKAFTGAEEIFSASTSEKTRVTEAKYKSPDTAPPVTPANIE